MMIADGLHQADTPVTLSVYARTGVSALPANVADIKRREPKRFLHDKGKTCRYGIGMSRSRLERLHP
jgi:hypothetical protein